MKKIVIFLILLLMFLCITAQGRKLCVLSEVLKPEGIEISDNRLYVTEGAKFFVYSLSDQKLIKRFGKKGEGPGELMAVPMLPNTIKKFHDKLFVEGVTKVIYYSNDLKILTEKRKKEGYRIFKMLPAGNNYAAVRMLQPTEKDKKYYLSLSLLDSDMNVKKELFRQEYPEREKEIIMVPDTIHFTVYMDKIYVEKSNEGFIIEVFDKNDSIY